MGLPWIQRPKMRKCWASKPNIDNMKWVQGPKIKYALGVRAHDYEMSTKTRD
ncbi:tripartite tricarboxylate transporter TctA [Sesbania bispinosa]|nr:tripartite tricarboxylate transporter TctA [Sesbania bispinosa]